MFIPTLISASQAFQVNPYKNVKIKIFNCKANLNLSLYTLHKLISNLMPHSQSVYTTGSVKVID
jgi:hypothetical protein